MSAENRVTIRDVARLSGVSKSTVSLVLNGGVGVAEGTAARVRDMLKRTGYRRDARAMIFRQNRPGPVGVVLSAAPDAATAALLAGLSARLAESALTMLLAVDGDLNSAVSALCERGASAIVIDGGATQLPAPDCPAVFLHSGPADATVARIAGQTALRLAARAARAAGAKRLTVIGAIPEFGDQIAETSAVLRIRKEAPNTVVLEPEDFVLCPLRIARMVQSRLGADRMVILGGDETGAFPQIRWDAHTLGREVGEAILAGIAGSPDTRREIVAPVWLSMPWTGRTSSDPRLAARAGVSLR